MGSVEPYVTAKGTRYKIRWRNPDHSQGAMRGFTTKRDALLELAKVDADNDRGVRINPEITKATIGSLGGEWLRAQSHLKPSSYRPVEIAWRLHVEPTFGRRAVGSLRHSEVQKWVTDLSATKSATTVLRAYGVLAGILDVAVKDRRLSSNPARDVNLPRKVGKKRVYLTHARVQLLADQSGHQATLVLFLAYTGLRWGEVTALRVRDVDALRRRVNVHENAVDVGGKIIVGTPKSHSSRSVPYPAFLAEDVARACEGKTREGLLFGNGSTHLRQPDSRRGWFVSAVRKAQAIDPEFDRVTIHDLRHTAASLAISAGANVKAVQRMLGHASAAMTLDTYADLFEDDLDAVAHALDQARSAANVSNPRPVVPLAMRKTP